MNDIEAGKTNDENALIAFVYFAVFQLATRVAFHDHLLPVCLPPPNMKELIAGTNCTVIGWGKKEDKNCELCCVDSLKFVKFLNAIRERQTFLFFPHHKIFCLFCIDRNSISV